MKPWKRVSWSLLGEWWCVPMSITSEEEFHMLREMSPIPGLAIHLVKDRLYGGFACAEDKDHRHVFLHTGAYTYCNPDENAPLSDEDRETTWEKLIQASENGGPFIGGGRFTENAPAEP